MTLSGSKLPAERAAELREHYSVPPVAPELAP